jgi:hypothetical protein
MKSDCTVAFTSAHVHAIGLQTVLWVARGVLIPAGQSVIRQQLFDGPRMPVDAFLSIASASVGLFGGEVQGRICTLCNEHRFTIDHHQRRRHRPCLSLGTEVMI